MAALQSDPMCRVCRGKQEESKLVTCCLCGEPMSRTYHRDRKALPQGLAAHARCRNPLKCGVCDVPILYADRSRGTARMRCYKHRNHEKARCWCCGRDFWGASAHYCSHKCRTRGPREDRPKVSGSAAQHRRRARKAGVKYDAVNRLKVFERDGWRCGICRKKIDRDVAYPHPSSASLDHIVPVAIGGDHVLENMQSAHLKCNRKKGIAADGEQLALIG